jgi:hypothetical protein
VHRRNLLRVAVLARVVIRLGVRFTKRDWLLTSLGFRVYNPSSVTATHVRAEIKIEPADGVVIVDNWQKSQRPAEFPLTSGIPIRSDISVNRHQRASSTSVSDMSSQRPTTGQTLVSTLEPDIPRNSALP